MTGWDGRRIVAGKFRVFDGRAFLPYDYDKRTALDLAARHAGITEREYQVWKATPSGLVKVATFDGAR